MQAKATPHLIRHPIFHPLVIALATGFMAIALTACGGGGSSSDSAGGGTTTPPVETPIAPTISAPPDNQSVVAGKTATFSVQASGSGTLSYQWKKNGTDIPTNATSSSYTTPAASIADNGAKYSVSVSNSVGTVTSNTATLEVVAKAVAATITTQPADQSVLTGQTATFLVKAAGTSLSYQWKKNGADIPGATSSSYTTPATTLADNGTKYLVNVSNTEGQVPSSDATLTVSDTAVAPTISTHPADSSVTEGQTASFSVTATGTAPLIYQWQKNDTDINGATSSTYTTPITAIGDNGALYSVVVINGTGFVTSNKATLTVTAAAVAPAITAQPANQSVTEGQTATFSVTASGTAPLGYQWKKGDTDISGANASTYTTNATAIGDSGAVFTVVVTNSAGSVTSSSATLTVSAVAPTISTQPTAQTITAGDMATFSVTATGTSPSYQWKKGGTVIPGATSSSYTTPAMSYAGNGAEYSVVVSNSAGTVTSSSATLTVNKTSILQSYGYVANASDGLYDKTECVQDNNTGLVWEGKTASPATSRLGTSTYTNYDSTGRAQKPIAPGSTTYVNPTQGEINASTNSIGYVNSVNAIGLCGYNDWRMPTQNELEGILASGGNPRIDTAWFPNTQADNYWTSTTTGGINEQTWVVIFQPGTGRTFGPRNFTLAVRLVRSSQ